MVIKICLAVNSTSTYAITCIMLGIEFNGSLSTGLLEILLGNGCVGLTRSTINFLFPSYSHFRKEVHSAHMIFSPLGNIRGFQPG